MPGADRTFTNSNRFSVREAFAAGDAVLLLNPKVPGRDYFCFGQRNFW